MTNLEKNEAAIQCFNEVIKFDPNNKAANNNKGTALIKLEKYEEAIKCLEKAIELDKNNKVAYL